MALLNYARLIALARFRWSTSLQHAKLTGNSITNMSSLRSCVRPMSSYACCISPNSYSNHLNLNFHTSSIHPIHRPFSSNDKPSEEVKSTDVDEKDLTVFQRFTKVYKEYGKTLIVVHTATSILWYGGFYMLARSGIDLLPILIKLGASVAMQAKFAAAGDFLVAYIIYELAKPVRYLCTLGATRQAVVYMRKIGYIPELKPEDKLRNLAKDGRANLKDKYQVQREDMKVKYAKKKAVYQKRWHSTRLSGMGSPLQRSNGIHRHPLPGSRHQPPDCGHPPPDSEHQPPDSGHQPPDSGHQPPDSGNQPPDSGHPPPDSEHPPPDSGHPPPDSEHQSSDSRNMTKQRQP